MSVQDDVGSAVAGGAAVGLALGLQFKRESQAARAWDSYADKVQSLELKIVNMNVELCDKRVEIADKNILLYQQEQEIIRIQKDAETKLGHQKELLTMMTERANELKQMLRRGSANTKVITELYNLLIDEITAVSNPENFASLDPLERQRVIGEQLDEFERSGKLTYNAVLKNPRA